MKKIFLAFALFFSMAAAASPQDDLWNAGNELYSAGDYAGATALYDSVRAMGYESAVLYYNLGNAHFKSGATGRAILNYNKAQLLAPADADIEYNLRAANMQVRDRIDVVPEFFLKKWARASMNILGSNGWAALSLLFLAVALAFTAVYLLSGRMSRRKLGFYTGAAFALLFVISLSFASVQRGRIVAPSHAIVMSSSAPVKSSPDAAGNDLFVLHEGTKVGVTGSLGQWREITIADGKKGWIDSSYIEMIND